MPINYPGSKWRTLFGYGGMNTPTLEAGDATMDSAGFVARAIAWHRVDDAMLIPRGRYNRKRGPTPEGDFGRDG